MDDSSPIFNFLSVCRVLVFLSLAFTSFLSLKGHVGPIGKESSDSEGLEAYRIESFKEHRPG